MKKNILITVLVFCVISISFCYIKLLDILVTKGGNSIFGSWNVSITDVIVSDTVGNAVSKMQTYTSTTATLTSTLLDPGDSIEYTIKLKNSGTVDAKLKELVPIIIGDVAAISYKIDAPSENSVLLPGEEIEVTVNAIYDDTFPVNDPVTSTKTISLTFDYIQAI